MTSPIEAEIFLEIARIRRGIIEEYLMYARIAERMAGITLQIARASAELD